jgi:prepilin-type N-terminal cleavage/methylation domain-containing protein
MTHSLSIHDHSVSREPVNHPRVRAPRHARKGFTLTELLVTIVIIATLATLSVIGVSSIRRNAHAATASVKDSTTFPHPLSSFRM